MQKLVRWRLWSELADDERGAVTVDWVVLTAAVVIAFFAVIVPVSNQVDSLLGETANLVASVVTIAQSW
jgi:Flp pilus assembly pilin Flp